MGANPAGLRGREYLRVSKDKSGKMRSPEQQHEANTRSAAANGITLGEPYRETKAVGASRYSKGQRLGFGDLMADLDADRFDADVLVLWENSRGSRKVREWLTLLELLELHDHFIWVTNEERLYDPRSPHDRRALLNAAVESEYEVAKTSLRIRRDAAANAAAGRPHGRAPYGLRAVYDKSTGALLNWEADPAPAGRSDWSRAQVVEELFRRVKAGHSFRRIARDFGAAGVVNGKGSPFSPEHLRHLGAKPAYTGLRVHRGELTEATWEKIVDRATWHQVQRILAGPKHQTSTSRPGRALYEFSMIVKCDTCSGPMSVAEQRPGRLEYRCQRAGHTRIGKAEVDAFLTTLVIGYLSRPDVYEEMSAAPERTEQAELLEARIAEAQRELIEAEAEEPGTLAESRTLGKLIDRLTRQIDEDRQRLRELTMPPELAAFLEPPGADVAERWRDAPVEVKRRVAAVLFSPAYPYLGQPRIRRSPNPRRGARLAERLTWRHDQAEV